MTSVASDGAQSLPTFTPVIWTDDPDLLRLASELSDPLSRFASGYDVQNIFSALYAVLWDGGSIRR
ncbi:hypothetical protein EUX98_g7575 [Antrodiella citrinella]|uniref:Uncharacterized protein n=1 Tax=Antrodiella citrinella TaxID=2447956 RepID=A0A4S4MLI2_9APHY|nr:hypothetical protein EUX98_g7575 [Antrodiella citrinella]